ncbi:MULTISPECIES: hypothetical protein [Marinobacter]|uniref:hypothetical protein n=1 Tax=Marinobacter TaxID=2742 RepID=UPI0012486C6C|nr:MULTISPECIES: hypothetical protein [Marinobacter]MBL3558576.1 hypothetical protein [Marinobacter sp. JB05H06]
MKSPKNTSIHHYLWCTTLAVIAACIMAMPAMAAQRVTLRLGSLNDFNYLSDLLTQVLEADGYEVEIIKVSNAPTSRMEWMLADGQITAMMLGETPQRSRRFMPVRVAMTDNLMNQRVLFITRGQQHRYDQVESVEDFRALGLMGGMGSAWRDYRIWLVNNLPVYGVPADWRRLYDMVAIGNRGIDYLPRGAQEMAKEWQDHPNLDVEQNLVLVYKKDHVLYVSPNEGELHRTLNKLMPEASRSGLIGNLIEKHYPEVFEPPVSLAKRRVIPLQGLRD